MMNRFMVIRNTIDPMVVGYGKDKASIKVLQYQSLPILITQQKGEL